MTTPLLLGLAGSVVVGFLVTWLLTSIVHEHAPRLHLVDAPTKSRKVHEDETPTGGGLAIAVGLAIGLGLLWGLWGPFPSALQSLSFWSGAALMLATGCWDDALVLDAKGKFGLQLIAAFLLLHSGAVLPLPGLSESLANGLSASLPFGDALYIIPLTMIWVVGIINAVNLIDGLDGLATGILGIAFLACAALFGVQGELGLVVVGVVMAGALFGFLPHNFKPASIFMGDSGSLFLGYLLAGYTLQAPLHSDPWMSVLILPMLLGVPLLDTGMAIVRRFASDHSTIFAPDRRHIHHRLIEQGSEKRAVYILYGVGAWFGSAAVLMSVLPIVWGCVLAGATVAIAGTWAWDLGCLTPVPAAEKVPSLPAEAPPSGDGITVSNATSAGEEGFDLETGNSPENGTTTMERSPMSVAPQ